MPELLDKAKSGDAKFFIQFGGQGSPYIRELKKLYENENLKPLYEAIFEGLEACMNRDDIKADNGPLPQGLDIRTWLNDDDKMPDDDYLSTAPVSIPLIGFTQIAHFSNLMNNGYNIGDLLANTAGVSGHSQGIIPGALIALGYEGDEFIKNAAKFVQFLFYIGFRSQQHFPNQNDKDGIAEKSLELGDKGLSPMAAVLGAKADDIKVFIDEYNASADDAMKLHISLYNMPDSNVVSAHPAAHLAFREKYKAKMDEAGMKQVYVRTSCPFHCELMAETEKIFVGDLETIDFKYSGADLKAPLYSIFDGHDYKDEENLGLTLFREMVILELNWDKAIGKMLDSSSGITHCIDFGPGKVTQRLTQSWTADTGVTVLSAAVPKDLKTLLA